ncbi:adenosine deaminase [bacterium]|nr:adenosine deaminase [bacterium]
MTPKLELHLHLEGAAPPRFIAGLAREKHIDIAGIFAPDGSYRYRGFAEFLKVYEAACTTLTRPEDYQRLTRAVLEAQAENGVIYTEIFLCPDFCGGRDPGAWREYLTAIRETADVLQHEAGITMKAVATIVRHFGPDKARQTALCAAETAGDFVVGIGIGGAETMGKLKDFAWAFDAAREAGLKPTMHAGEWRGPSEVRDALALGALRIGHGIRAIEDLALVDELAERGTVLECCPGSNVALGLYPDFRMHPIGKLYDRGVKVTVSTDDPPFFHTTLTREYERLHDAFDWDAGVFATLNRTALDAAFCDKDTKDRIGKLLEAASV